MIGAIRQFCPVDPGLAPISVVIKLSMMSIHSHAVYSFVIRSALRFRRIERAWLQRILAVLNILVITGFTSYGGTLLGKDLRPLSAESTLIELEEAFLTDPKMLRIWGSKQFDTLDP
ncbi:MAG: hypothetical protein M3Q07_24650, partial [Pseudobdellovibrionaceae bacterium]|nr:hypothetical protein [Pseudobdellovibrionaceae bacterium]